VSDGLFAAIGQLLVSLHLRRGVAMSAIENIIAKLDGPRQSGDSWSAKCPAHEDRNPSLSVTERTEGDPGAVVFCHAGCSSEAVVSALGITVADLYDKPAQASQQRHIDSVYPYTDEAGKTLFEAVRYKPKEFRQRRVLDNGERVHKLGDVRRVLYRLPEVIAAVANGETVYVVEGEKDVAALEQKGVVATCSPMGAGKWGKVPDAADILKGAEVVIVIDKDDAGIAHGRDVAASLIGVADNVTVMRAEIGNDAADHLGAGRSVDDLEFVASDSPALINAGQGIDITEWINDRSSDPAELATVTDLPEPIDWHELFARDGDHEWLIEDFWPARRQLHIHAARKTGKSLLTLWIAANLATGRDPFSGRPCEPTKVTYLDYEMNDDDILERVEDMGFTADQLKGRLVYYLIPGLAPLDTDAGGAALLRLVERDQSGVVIIDTLSRVVAGKENDNDTFQDFFRFTGMRLKKAGIAMARLDHEGHEGNRSRGASTKADDVDVVWQLKKSDEGMTLVRKAARMSWVADKIDLKMGQEPLLFARTTDGWPEGTKEKAAELDRLGLPTNISRRNAADAMTKANITPGRIVVLSKAIAYRKVQASSLMLEVA
jgi:hypothetical protein